MAEAIALRSVIPFACPSTRDIFSRLNRLIENTNILARRMNHDEMAREIMNTVFNHMHRYQNLSPQDFEEHKKELKIYVAKNTKDAIKECNRQFKRLFNESQEDRGILRKAQSGANQGLADEKLLGLYAPYIEIVFINLENIKKEHANEIDFQKSSFYVTTIHELIHAFGEFERYKNYKLEWLNEGVAESLAKEIARDAYERIVRDKMDDACESYRQLMNCLDRLLGKEIILEAFFKRDVEIIICRMRQIGISEKDIEEIFQAGNELSVEKSSSEHFEQISGRLARHLNELTDKTGKTRKELEKAEREEQLRQRKLAGLKQAFDHITNSVCAYAAPLVRASGATPRNLGVPLRQIERMLATGRESVPPSDCFALVRNTLRSVGGFRHEANWLESAILERISRKIMRKYHGNDFNILDHETLQGGRFSADVAKRMAEIVSERTLERAFFTSNLNLVKEEMEWNGLTKAEISNLFTLGSKVVGNEREFIRRLNVLRRKMRRIEEELALDDIQENPESVDWEGMFGKAWPLATENISKPVSERQKMKGNLREKKLLPEEIGPVSSFEELRSALVANYNGSSNFLADLFMSSAEAHLTLLKGSPSPERIAELANDLTSEFSQQYVAKPTLLQLVNLLGEEIYYTYSQPIEISEFFGLKGRETESETVQQIEKYKSFRKSAGLEAVLPRLTEFGIIVANPADIGKLFERADEVSRACKRPPNEGMFATVEVLVAAKSKLGNATASYQASQMIGELEKALAANFSSLKPSKSIKTSEADAYLRAHLDARDPKSRQQQATALQRINENLNLIYPGSIISFDSSHGFARFTRRGATNPGGPAIGQMPQFTPYAGLEEDFRAVLRSHGFKTSINPLKAGRRVKADRNALDERSRGIHWTTENKPFHTITYHSVRFKSDLARFAHVFMEYRSGGRKGIKFDTDSKRPNGFLTPEEVLKRRYALCLEHACLFLALNSQYQDKVFAFKVFSDESGNMFAHVTPGVFIEMDEENRKLLALIAEDKKSLFLSHYRFEKDREYRSNLLREVGIRTDFTGSLVLFDLSLNNFGAQYQSMQPITRAEELLSAYFVDKGSYHFKGGTNAAALQNYEIALRINPEDQLAKSHLIAYYSRIEPNLQRVLELSSNLDSLVNTDDLISRSVALLSRGDAGNTVEALLKAIQLSEHALKARILLDKMLYTAKK